MVDEPTTNSRQCKEKVFVEIRLHVFNHFGASDLDTVDLVPVGQRAVIVLDS